VRWLVSIILGIAVGLGWLGIWSYSLCLFGIAAFSRQSVDRAGRRERIKELGKLRYVLIFGVLGPGIAFGLALVAVDLLDQLYRGWVSAMLKLVSLSVFFGSWQGVRTWSEEFRDPVQFPSDYSSLK
jgi:hypothetical protein